MPPTPKPKSPQSRVRYCGLGNHPLQPPHKTIKDEKMLNFARKINPELRRSTLICGACFETLEKIYQLKLKNAVQHHRARKRAAGNTNSLSDVSSSQQQRSSSVTSLQAMNSLSSTTTSEADSSSSSAKRRRVEPQPAAPVAAADEDDDDDDEPRLSLNAVNGTRLPHIQPIPRRRQFVTLNKTAMDIYLAGTTGG
ncbi:hypothetical protein KR222_001083 [Zaprionus bogoriensis]|nr:hypothetical protein KR222_001083 [Zaprionus bogoriensis]